MVACLHSGSCAVSPPLRRSNETAACRSAIPQLKLLTSPTLLIVSLRPTSCSQSRTHLHALTGNVNFIVVGDQAHPLVFSACTALRCSVSCNTAANQAHRSIASCPQHWQGQLQFRGRRSSQPRLSRRGLPRHTGSQLERSSRQSLPSRYPRRVSAQAVVSVLPRLTAHDPITLRSSTGIVSFSNDEYEAHHVFPSRAHCEVSFHVETSSLSLCPPGLSWECQLRVDNLQLTMLS